MVEQFLDCFCVEHSLPPCIAQIMYPTQVVIESDRLDVVCFKEFALVHVCFRVVYTAQADG